MSSLTDLTDAVLPTIRTRAAEVANDGRSGNQVIFTSQPSPTTQLPYGYIRVVGEPDAGLVGESVTQVQLSWWGAYWVVAEFADRLAWLDGLRLGEYGVLRGLRYSRESRNITAEPDASGVWALQDLYTARFFSTRRTLLEVAMT